MSHERNRAAQTGAMLALRTAVWVAIALQVANVHVVGRLGDLTLVFLAFALAAFDCFVAIRRRSEPALDPGDPLTMLGPVWIAHPESDRPQPPRRFA